MLLANRSWRYLTEHLFLNTTVDKGITPAERYEIRSTVYCLHALGLEWGEVVSTCYIGGLQNTKYQTTEYGAPTAPCSVLALDLFVIDARQNKKEQKA